jgi:hypothetical protein
MLVKLIECLFKDWYVARYNRAEALKGIEEMAVQKNQQRDTAKNKKMLSKQG